MNDFSSIWLSLDVHRDKINAIVAEYRGTDRRNRENFSDSYYQEQHNELIAKYQDKIAREKEKAEDTLNTYFDNIQTVLDKWVSAPLPESKINLLYLLMQSGIKLSRVEFEVLKKSVGNNYFGNRILSALAERDGIPVKKVYGLETYERILEDCISSADVFLHGFYGSSPAWELVPGSTHKHIVTAAAAGVPLKDGCALHRAALLWDGSSVPCSKTKINSEDKDVLNKLYSGCNDDSTKAIRTKELLSEMPELKETLQLTEYSGYIPKEKKEKGEKG